MKDKTLTIHIGYPKTATTTLQKFLFATNDKIYYLGKYPPSYNPKNRIVMNFTKKLHEQNKMDFKRSLVDLPLLSFLQDSQHNLFLLSEEAIIDKCFTPTRNNNVRQDLNDLFGKISVLMETHKVKIRILITLRRQEELIPSFFAQKYEQFKEAGYPDLSRYVKVLTGPHGEAIGVQALNFFHIFRELKSIMPIEDIGIVSIHGLKRCDKKAMETLSDFSRSNIKYINNALQKKENKRMKNKNVWVSRNTKIILFLSMLSKAIKVNQTKRHRIRQAIESRFSLTIGKKINLTNDDYYRISTVKSSFLKRTLNTQGLA